MEEINNIPQEELTNVLSDIAESISNEELKVLIHYLKNTQPTIKTTSAILERKQKKIELLTLKLQRQQLLPKYPTAEHVARQQLLRGKQLQEQEEIYESMNILGDSILEYELAKDKPRKISPEKKKMEVISYEQKLEREQLRQMQLQEQEDLYDQVDLLGETLVKFHPLQSSSREYMESHADTIISIPSEATPETSSAPRRTYKYLSPEQVAQLRKIRQIRYEQQEQEYLDSNILGESLPKQLKDKYSFRPPNTRLQSPRELLFRKSIINVKKNKGKHSKSLVIPVMNFPPTNWPTPIIPEIRQEKLRQEQHQYFIAMQQANTLGKSQNPNQDQDQSQNIIQEENLNSIQNQQKHPRQNQNTYSRNLKDSDDGEELSSKEERHKFMKHVYIILFLQWSLITGIVSLFKYHKPSSLWLASSYKWTWLYILCTLNVVILSFTVFPATRHYFPINLMMLTFFTLLVAFTFSFVEIFYPNDSVILALGCTCLICVVLALFFCQKRCNYTIYNGLLLCSAIIILFLGIVNLLINASILEIVYAAIGVIVYSIYIVWNTNAILKKESQFHTEFDTYIQFYILGAINLNLDFIFISIEKLRS